MTGRQECSRLPVDILNGTFLIWMRPFYEAIPDKTLTLNGQWCKGGEMAKQMITTVLCTNLCGEKEILVMHTAVHPRCFKNILLPDVSYANKKVWCYYIFTS